MNILLMSPQPFYQERGTPIAIDLLVKALSEQGHHTDLLVFGEGEDRQYPNLAIHRVKSFPNVHGIKPGFSAKKLYLDCWMFFKLIKMLATKKYDVVHAGEESAFLALILKPFFSYKFIHDIDSSMTTQLVDKAPFLNIAKGAFQWIESLPMRFADAVVPVCDALADEVYKYRSDGVFILKDIDLGETSNDSTFKPSTNDELRNAFKNPELPLFMYIGNLEAYQGIDLMLNSFAKMLSSSKHQNNAANLVVIGGDDSDIHHYKQKSHALNISAHVVFAGKRPVAALAYFMQQANFLVSPRTQGVNTPMKIYSYLGSGKPVLATRLATHTQVMDDDIAILADASITDFAGAMSSLLSGECQHEQKAQAASNFIQQEHSYAAFSNTLKRIYDSVKD